jgi:hypothetical protein
MIDQILDAWDINHDITLHLDHIDRAGRPPAEPRTAP